MRITLFIALFFSATSVFAKLDLSKISRDLLSYADLIRGRNIIALPFEHYKQPKSEWGKKLSRQLAAELTQKKELHIIDMQTVENALAGIKYQDSDIDRKKIQKIGKQLNADLLILGTIIDQKSGFSRLNIRIVELESFLVIAAANQTVRLKH